MARESYEIEVSSSGAREVKRTLDEIVGSAQKATNVFSRMQNAMSFAFGVYGLGVIKQYVDGYSDMTSKLRIATDSVSELTRAEEALFGVAQRTYSGLSETVDLYTRLERSTRGLGISQDNLLQITESVNKAVQLSGASAQAANASIIQLGQGLASGALRGDELRSVLEQTPALAQAIAAGMGVAVGELKSLGTEGKLTTEVVLNALARSTAGIDKEFDNVILTIGKGWTTLTNSIQKGLGQLDRELGVSSGISKGLSWIGNHLDDITASAKVAAVGIALIYAPSIIAGITTVIGLVKALTVAIAANPLGALLVGATAVISTLTLLRDEIQPIEGSIATLGDVGEATFNVLSKKSEGFITDIKGSFKTFYEENSGIIGVLSQAAINVFNDVVNFGKNVLNFWTGLGVFLTSLPSTIVSSWKANIEQALTNMGAMFTGFMNDIKAFADGDFSFSNFKKAQEETVGGFSTMADDITGLASSAFGTDYVQGTIDDIKTGIATVKTATKGTIDEIIVESDRLANSRIESEKKTQDAYIKTDQILQGTGNTQDKINKDLVKYLKIKQRYLNELQSGDGYSYQREMDAINAWAKLEKEKLLEVETGHEELARLIDEVYAQRVTDAYDRMLDAATDWDSGVKRTMRDWSKTVNDEATMASDSMESFANNGANAIADFAKTGEFDFGKFAEAVATDILMMTTRMLMMRMIMATIGYMGGGGGGMDGISTMGGGGTMYAANGTNGPITGYGTSTSDSIPAMLSKGEWVINASGAKGNEDLLRAINAGQLKRFNSGGPASGGTVVSAGSGRNAKELNLSMPSTIIIEGDASSKTVDEIQRAMQVTREETIAEVIRQLSSNGNLANIVRSIR